MNEYSEKSKMVTELRVHDIMRFTEDRQRVLIIDKEPHSKKNVLFFGEMQDIPLKFYDLRVSKFYSDYSYYKNYPDAFIVLRIINPTK